MVTDPTLDDINEPSPSTSSASHQIETPIVVSLCDSVDVIIQDEPGNSIQSSSSTSTVSTARTAQQLQIKDAFRKISSYSEGGSRSAKITNAIMYMICRDLLPLSHVEDQGFRFLMKVTAPLYTVPSRRKITLMIDEKYELLVNVYKIKLFNTDNVTLTADIWTESLNTKSFMGVTMHYLQETHLVSATIGVIELKESHSSENISKVLLSTCNEWNIEAHKVTAVVTDNAANMVKGIHYAFSRKKHLPCFAHTLNLVPIKAIELTKGLPEMISQIKSIVTWFKHSVQGADMLRKVQMESGRSEGNVLKLKQDIPTRWNSCFYMLDQFLKLKDCLTVVLIKFPQAPPMLTAFQLEEVKEVIELLKPIESISKELSGSSYVTCSKIIPLVNCLEAHIEATNPTLQMSCNLKKNLQDEVQKRFGKTEGVSLLAQATLLDPRFKKIHFRDPLCCSQAIKSVASTMREYQSEDETAIGTSLEAMESQQQGDKFDLWHHHKQLVAKKMGTSQTEGGNLFPGNSPTQSGADSAMTTESAKCKTSPDSTIAYI
ncbi:E3 SUMO-protein ligase ZBED1-like [Ischnura elegans]|uniref:E3 SUMO-protein ligase ZBED1-like n=1 Tax=Ischnura elegans TaxID=197161 RepID=UPI001ED8AF84|nr:E3 SUMO-protein ligase ZBED1-like [Ischnura elegans]